MELYSVLYGDLNGKKSKQEGTYVHVWLTHFAVCEKLTQQWNATILQFKKKKIGHIYTMEYYSAIKKNEIMPFAAKWMQPEIIILSEVIQKEKDKFCLYHL